MQLTIIWQNIQPMHDYMQKQSYSPPYITRHLQMSHFIIKRASKYRWKTLNDVIFWFEHQSYTERYIKEVKKILFNLEFFSAHGCFPGNGTVKRELLYQAPSIGSLDMTYLQNHLPELISYMKEHDYSESILRRLHFIANRIIVLSRTTEWNSYQDIYSWYCSQHLRHFYLKGVREILGILEAFHNRNEMPNNRETQNILCVSFSNYSLLIPHFKKLVDLSIDISSKRGLAQGTIKSMKAVVSTFLAAMQTSGALSLRDITSVMIAGYLTPYVSIKGGRGVTSKLRSFFSTLLPFDKECSRLLAEIPILQYGRKNIQYLTQKESDEFRNALRDYSNGLTYKCRAIGTLLFYTGLRKSDIVNLTYDSLDLKKNLIRIFQQKTGSFLELPLSPVVGNAIYDYCMNERPPCEEKFIFVGRYAPHRKNGTSAIDHAINSIMKVAKIRQSPSDRKGSHIFRHRAATEMMSNNTAPAIISHTLGHASPKSLNPYLYADVVHLRECALGISSFPLSKEVIDHV